MRMLWIGGTQGAGTSTLAQDLALTHDLPVRHIDAYTFAHAARLATRPSLDEQLAQGPAAAADAWDEISRERLPLICQICLPETSVTSRRSSRVRS